MLIKKPLSGNFTRNLASCTLSTRTIHPSSLTGRNSWHSSFLKDFRSVFVVLGNGKASVYRISEQRPRLSVQYQEDPHVDASIADPLVEPPRAVVLLSGRALSVGARNSSIRIWNPEGELLQEIKADRPRGTDTHKLFMPLPDKF